MLNQSVKLTPELLAEIENFIEENKRLGFTTREELIRDAIRWRLKFLKKESEYVEILKDKYEKLEAAIKEMSMPYCNASDFLHKQVDEMLEKYEEWKKARQKRQLHDATINYKNV
jgi:Arc/MetJ-type ribon-helix-helix transcriptional regulator